MSSSGERCSIRTSFDMVKTVSGVARFTQNVSDFNKQVFRISIILYDKFDYALLLELFHG